MVTDRPATMLTRSSPSVMAKAVRVTKTRKSASRTPPTSDVVASSATDFRCVDSKARALREDVRLLRDMRPTTDYGG